ncbi:MAG: ribonuclease III [Lachnospiraceae bacterium]|nr:ribonuclease III [Lachnospiraceae bacterium]MCI9370528.1 ribonuclease III [Lachnospiraceae bacterium]
MEESINLYEKILREFKIKKQDISTYSPLTLAYIGDGIYEIVIRSLVVGHGNGQVNKLHKKSSSLVKAETQSKIIKLLMDELTEEEVHIFKRGRNAHSFTSAKNASSADYHMATGFEAVMGYLYMEGRMQRIFELVERGLEKIEVVW